MGGMGASIAQKVNGQYTFLFAVISLIVTLVMVIEFYRRRHSKLIVISVVVLMLTHPIWTVSAIGGDLGYGQRDLAFAWTAIVVSMLFVMYFRQSNRNLGNHVTCLSRPNASAE